MSQCRSCASPYILVPRPWVPTCPSARNMGASVSQHLSMQELCTAVCPNAEAMGLSMSQYRRWTSHHVPVLSCRSQHDFWGRGSQHIPVWVLCTLARPSAKPMGPSAKPVYLSAFQTLPTLPEGNVDSEALELGCWEPGVPLLHAGRAPWDHQSRSPADAAGPVPRRAALPLALPSHPLPFLCADTLGMAFGCFL